jgi:hypothetical protein
MPLRARKSIRLGSRRLHLAWHFTQTGYTSWSVKVRPWSWNSRTRAHRVDLPGPVHWTSKRGRRSSR